MKKQRPSSRKQWDMPPRTTKIIVAILVLLGGGIVRTEFKQKDMDEKQQEIKAAVDTALFKQILQQSRDTSWKLTQSRRWSHMDTVNEQDRLRDSVILSEIIKLQKN